MPFRKLPMLLFGVAIFPRLRLPLVSVHGSYATRDPAALRKKSLQAFSVALAGSHVLTAAESSDARRGPIRLSKSRPGLTGEGSLRHRRRHPKPLEMKLRRETWL